MCQTPSLKSVSRWAMMLALTVFSTLSPHPSAPAVAAELALGATLTVLADPVEVAPADASDVFSPATAGQLLKPGDQIRTGQNGIALVTFFDGSESQLGSGGLLQIARADYDPAPHIALFQSSGVTVNRVIPLCEGGSFETDTPTATGLVRGTSFVVSVSTTGDSPLDSTPSGAPSSSFVLLTDLDGHVGHLSVVHAPTGNDPVAPVELTTPGAASTADGTRLAALVLGELTVERLERAAHNLNDVSNARETRDQIGKIASDAVPTDTPRAVDAADSQTGQPPKPTDDAGLSAGAAGPKTATPTRPSPPSPTSPQSDTHSVGASAAAAPAKLAPAPNSAVPATTSSGSNASTTSPPKSSTSVKSSTSSVSSSPKGKP